MALPGSPRLSWDELPQHVRHAVERRLGARVVRAATADGGFSPGVAAIVATDAHDRVFVKSAGRALNEETVAAHRREAATMPALPAGVPAPAMRFAIDDGDWVTLVFDAIDGVPPRQPWHEHELCRVLAVLDVVVALAAGDTLEPWAERHRTMFDGWHRLAAGDGTDALDEWSRRHLDALVALEAGWMEASAGSALVHSDVRADNVLLTDDAVVVVDWAHAARGAPWLDLLLMLPSVELEGGPPAGEIWRTHALGRSGERVPDAVDAVLAAFTGFLVHRSTLPPPPGLPTLRAFQAAQAGPALRWLRERVRLGTAA